MSEHPAFRSRAAESLSWHGHVHRLLDVESALARSQGELGIIPSDAASAIAAACGDGIDRAELARRARDDATPVISLTGLLREALTAQHGAYVHHGATSQDVIDTALVLQVREASRLLVQDLEAIGGHCARLADEHRDTLMVGRTLLQHAVPVTFGLTAAHWLAMMGRSRERLRTACGKLPVQLGGAAGTLAPYGQAGTALVERVADHLGLAVPTLPWHTDRDVLHELVVEVGLAAGSLGKLALDLTLLAQTEVGELIDPEAGGSSTMPHKRNPADPSFAVASARLAVGAVSEVLPAAIQEHQRAAGAWQLEWVAIPRALDHAIASAERVRAVLERIEVDAAAMRRNLDRTGGSIMSESLALALAPKLGRTAAADLVSELLDRATSTGTTLAEVTRADDRVRRILGSDRLDGHLDPANYLGSTGEFIDRALAHWQSL